MTIARDTNRLTPGPGLETELNAWLRELGHDEPRRIVRQDGNAMLLSRFEEGFAARLMANVEALPGLLDLDTVREAYAACRDESPADQRVDLWQRAILRVLSQDAAEAGLDIIEQTEVRAGIESVGALLGSILWTGPLGGEDYTPQPGERAAYDDVLEKMDQHPGVFTRHYGTFDGRRVETHCPGTRVARILLDHAWTVCTEG